MVEEVYHGVLNKEPGCDQGQAAVLAVKAVMVSVEGKVVQVKEPQPMAFASVGVTADSIILVS